MMLRVFNYNTLEKVLKDNYFVLLLACSVLYVVNLSTSLYSVLCRCSLNRLISFDRCLVLKLIQITCDRLQFIQLSLTFLPAVVSTAVAGMADQGVH